MLYKKMKYLLEEVGEPEEAADMKLHPDRFDELFKSKNPETHFALANNPATPPHILSKMSDSYDPNLTKAVAGNPNTPGHVLANLFFKRGHTAEILNNPALALHVLETPPEASHEKPADAFLNQMLHMAKSPDNPYAAYNSDESLILGSTNTSVVDNFAAHSDPKLRASAAHNPSISKSSAQELVTDPSPLVRNRIASQETKLNPEHIELLSRDPIAAVRERIAGNRYTKPEIIHRLADDPDSDVVERVARRSTIHPDTEAKLAKNPDPHIRGLIAQNDFASPHTLTNLANDPDLEVKKHVAWHRNTPKKALHMLATKEHAVTADPNNELENNLANETNKYIRSAVASNDNTHADTLKYLASLPSNDLDYKIAGHPNASPDILHSLALRMDDNGDETTAYNLAAHTETPEKTLHLLHNYPDEGIRRIVAGHKNTGKHTHTSMLKDQDSDVRRAAKIALKNNNYLEDY